MERSDVLALGRSRLAIRARDRWTQMWRRDDEVEECKELGYVHVRKAVLDKDGNSEKPGKETGEVLKLNEGSESTLYAMEIDAARMERHNEAIAKMSQERFDTSLQGVHESIENANSSIGRKGGALKGMITNEQPVEEFDPGAAAKRRAKSA